ncbi:hypothetical protein DAEQUDRAFT_732796 [Daedalea quercina L-15889]|uniref:ABM domain-containing protein n=1 Tax=Daedalea quercina L-15889 TaxID=1314783 RepID=A0A165LDW6_9APHY|nr:hypothetical protein DAEQUDRAFT_732796 [Daedalea quercina L-15889]
MTTVVELIIVDVKEGVGKDDAILKKLREAAAKGGLKHQSYGFTVENPNKYVWILYIENGFEAKDFKWPAAEYGDFAEELKKVSTSDFTRYFFSFPSFPPTITSAPVTETALITLKADVDLAQFNLLQEGIIGQLKQQPTVLGTTHAITTEAGANPIVLLFVGWESVEAHKALVAKPENQGELAKFQVYMDKLDAVHVHFTNEE